MKKIIPVILAGGSGTRLWPLSRRDVPKPFIPIGNKTLFASAVELAKLISEDLLIVINEDHHHLAEAILSEMPYSKGVNYLLEPVGRNTAPAIALALQCISRKWGDDVSVIVLAADHLITSQNLFLDAVNTAIEHAGVSKIALFGVKPTSPETGYGYLEVTETPDTCQDLKSFVEKPDRSKALQYLASGRYLWNSGMFCFAVSTMKTEFLSLTPALWDACEKAFINCNERNSCCFFSLESFQQIPSISIDYAIMEKSSNLCVLLSHFGWSDLGEWEAVSRHHAPDSSGNTWAGDGEHFYLDTSNTHIHASGHDKKLVASIGIKDLVVVNTPDVLMIADKSEAHRVKELVECLKGQERTSEITRIGTTVYRPWGQYTTMTTGPNHLIKRITVAPGQKLSLQLHHHRSEHWVVVKGKALVQVGSKKQHSGEGAYHFIPKGETHRLTNIGVDLLHLVEIQFGEHLDEDDIVRLADEYGRSSVD